MNKILAAALGALALLGGTQAVNAQKSPVVNEISRYVSPNNGYKSVNYQYLPGGATYAELSDDHRRVVEKDLRTGKEVEVLFDASNTRENSVSVIDRFVVSPNKKQVLVYTDTQPVYRRSSTSKCYVYEVRTRLLTPLSKEHPRQQSPVFSPNSRMIAFVADNNIYIKKLDYGSEVAVTTDGERNKIINGIPDWVYEEEFTTSCSMTWAPDNLNLCYLKYNETDVKMFDFPLYQGSCHPMDQYALYPGQYSYKYPVAGEANSKVSIHSYDVETRKTKDIILGDGNIEYIPRLVYGPTPETLLAVTLNRDQNRMEIYSVNPKSTVSRSILVEESKTWIAPESYEEIWYGPASFVMSSNRTGWTNLYEYSYTGELKSTITKGEIDVTAYYGRDAVGNQYYQKAAPTPMDRVIVKKDRKGVETVISPEKGWSTGKFTDDCSLYVLNHSDVNTPPVFTLKATAGNKTVRVLEDNAEVKTRFAGMLQPKEFITVNSDGYKLNGWIIKPAGFDSTKKYPVIMTQYSGPASQEVVNRWGVDWYQYFAHEGFIVACVDGRGTGARGRAFSDCTYKNLGHFETIDQINAAREIGRLPYVDASHIGIYGWSFGGYETLMCVTDPNSPFYAAVAVAPVTDWRYYDSVYAERYMLTPGQNNEGYVESAPINRVRNLNCPVLIIHGTADDNVHFSNTIEFVSRMEAYGILGDQLIFPNMNHSINGCNSRAVVYASMFRHFKRNL